MKATRRESIGGDKKSGNRHIHKAAARTRDFNFSLAGLTGFDLHGKTAGVVGTGKIGRIFADICTGFGMRVLAYDAFPNPATGLEYVTLDRLLAESDIVSLHCPLLPETKHLINADTLAKAKRGFRVSSQVQESSRVSHPSSARRPLR